MIVDRREACATCSQEDLGQGIQDQPTRFPFYQFRESPTVLTLLQSSHLPAPGTEASIAHCSEGRRMLAQPNLIRWELVRTLVAR